MTAGVLRVSNGVIIVPFAPSTGGNWERMIGLSKHLISATAAREYYRSINTEELSTYFNEVERIWNWRLLTAVYSKHDDFDYLSPISILNAGTLASGLPGHFIKFDGICDTWRTTQLMAQDFWKKWQRLHLPTLIPRMIWNSPQPNFKLGDLILLNDYTLVKNNWSHTRVHKIFPNKDKKEGV